MTEIVLNTDVKQPTLQEQADAQDAARAEAAKTNPPAQTDRPDWLPEGFATVDAFVKSQKDGRAELTRLQQELATLKKGAETVPPKPGEPTPPVDPNAPKPPAKTPEELAAASAADQQQAAQDALTAAKVDVAPFQQEFAQTGDVSAENRAKLAEALKGQFGDNAKTLVDGFIEGQKAARDNYRNTVLGEVGGAEKYAEVTTWAKASLKPAEIEAYNRAVDSGDVNAAALAVRGLMQSYTAANGRAPSLVSGNNAAPGSGADAPFESTAQMTNAINDPRYAKDDAYRAGVVRRIQASKF